MDIAAFKRELFAITYDLQKILHDTMTPICQEHGLTLQQMHVLVELMRTPGLTAGQLSDRAGILRTNFSPVCRKLENRGLIERQRSQTDRRSLRLHVTDEGRALLASVDGEVQRRYGRAFSAEPQETFDAILEGFQALSAFLGKLVRLTGLEPTRRIDTSTSSWPVYQFQHSRKSMFPGKDCLIIIARTESIVNR